MTAISKDQVSVENCRNCGAAVDYHYCAVCGQETKLHVPSASEFIHEFVAHYVAVEGRLWKTLALLLFKPGFLTWEYIQGRRVRYVEPLRIYLTFSLLFFAVLKFGGVEMYQEDAVAVPVPPAATHGTAPAIPGFGAAPEAPATPARRGMDRNTDVRAVPSAVAGQPGRSATPPPAAAGQGIDVVVGEHTLDIGHRFNAFMARPLAERQAIVKSAFFAYVPYALFCLMPLFALYLKLLYLGSGRRYGEHLLFALHANAFAFAIISVLILINPLQWGLLNVALNAWLLFYLPLAMRRVYGGSRFVTFVRWAALALVHVLSVIVALLSTVGWAVLR